MSNDKDKLLQILASLESDYSHGKISREKYLYFRSKYEDKLNALDAREATNRIRSMQGKPSNSPKETKKPIKNKKAEDEDLVQKYIINPKKGDNVKKEKSSMDSGTFKLVAILILAIGFTVGAGFGVFNFDFGSITDSTASAIVTDTAFPDVDDIQVNNTATDNNVTSNTQVQTTQDTSTYSYDSSSSYSYDSGSSSSDSSGSGSGSGSNTPSSNTPSSNTPVEA